MLITKEFLATIKPKSVNKSDKFSCGIYKALTSLLGQDIRVYSLQRSNWDGSFMAFNPDSPKFYDIWFIKDIDKEGWFYGLQLSTVLQKKVQSFALPPRKENNALDVSDWFFNGYPQQGRGLLDPQGNVSFMDGESRWSLVSPTQKRCNWSGRTYKLREEQRIVIDTFWDLEC